MNRTARVLLRYVGTQFPVRMNAPALVKSRTKRFRGNVARSWARARGAIMAYTASIGYDRFRRSQLRTYGFFRPGRDWVF